MEYTAIRPHVVRLLDNAKDANAFKDLEAALSQYPYHVRMNIAALIGNEFHSHKGFIGLIQLLQIVI
jgi:hypothetical protein